MMNKGETAQMAIERLETENAKLRTSETAWKVVAENAVEGRNEAVLQVGELKKLITQALPFMRARHQWKPTAPHATMIKVLESAVAKNREGRS